MQILTLENYQQTMFSVVRADNYGATAWFVLWILIGKYIFLSLFLAVTLEAFDTRWGGCCLLPRRFKGRNLLTGTEV